MGRAPHPDSSSACGRLRVTIDNKNLILKLIIESKGDLDYRADGEDVGEIAVAERFGFRLFA